MAEQIPYSIAEQLLKKLGSHVFKEIAMMYGVEDDLKKLRDSLSSVNAVLLDAEEKQEKSHAVEVWVRRLKEIVYDADDLLDDIATEDLRKQVRGRRKLARKVRDFFSSSNQIWFRYKVGRGIKDIKERFNEVKNDIADLNFEKRVIVADERVGKDSGRETASFVRQSEIIGREKDKENIIESLMVNSVGNGSNISVVAIAGFGGLGKTALAQLVYNDEKVDMYFDKKIWVCVSDEFDVKLLIKKILNVASSEKRQQLEQLQISLRENLEGKRYLLVLDDVWNEDVLKWDDLRKYLSVGAPGSKILATTRSKKVALVMGAESPYDLRGLAEEEAWDLFQKLAFGERASSSAVAMNPNLIKIGEAIVKKCKGVPLAIRALGNLMRFKSKESEWSSLLANDLWRLVERKGDIFPVLKLSYDYLPTHLRQCFTYCAMFPKDYEFDKLMLIRLWIAQGYIVDAGSSNECLEETGKQYFNELLFRSFFQFFRVEYGKEYYKMHDLIHDLAQSLSKDSCLVVEVNNMGKISERNQHVYWRSFRVHIKILAEVKGVRTFFIESCCSRHLNDITSSCRKLRALNCHFSEEIPISIGRLKHLRYLDLSKSELKTLPNSITNLPNLQTLVLINCYQLLELPRDIQNLISLRCLLIDNCWDLEGMPMGLGKLTCLQRLSNFKVHNGKAVLNELEHLNQLRGSLSIDGLKNVRSCESESKNVNLLVKEHLQRLELNWRDERIKYLLFHNRGDEINSAAEESEFEMLLEKLQPHPNLQELHVTWYLGAIFSNWLPQITNLVDINLLYCPNMKWMPPLDQLPYLRTLSLSGLEAMEYISDEDEVKESFFVSEDESCFLSDDESSYAVFPSLQDIKFDSCGSLKGWWRRKRRNHFPSLLHLYIRRCKDLTSLQELGMHQLTSLQELTIEDCPMLAESCEKEKGVDWHIISHVPKFTIES